MLVVRESKALTSLVAEWLELTELPALQRREVAVPSLTGLDRIVAFVGPRRAGKTYLMYQLLDELLSSGLAERRDILFVDFEDYRLAGLEPGEMDRLLAIFHRLAGQAPRFLFLDEIQRLPDWHRVLRTLHNRRRYTIVVSGSNSRLLYPEISTELRGRYEDILVLPFSFREYLKLKQIDVKPATLHTPLRGRVAGAFEKYLKTGGFPEVLLAATSLERQKLLQTYYRTIYYRDVVDRYRIRTRATLETLMAELLEGFASQFSVSRYAELLKAHGIPGTKRTVANFLCYLQEAFFVFCHEKFSYSPRRRLMNPKKVYLVDTGFAAMGRSFSENRGRILENAVAIELHRRGQSVYYFKGRRECDFLLCRDGRPVEAIQVCWELTPRNERRELAGLAEVARTLGVDRLSVLTFDRRATAEVAGRSVAVIPAWEWILGLEGTAVA